MSFKKPDSYIIGRHGGWSRRSWGTEDEYDKNTLYKILKKPNKFEKEKLKEEQCHAKYLKDSCSNSKFN